MDEEQEAARRFVREILRVTGWTASQLAKRAGISHTTLTRFLNGDVTHTLSGRTLRKIQDAAGREVPREHIEYLWLLSRRDPAFVSADQRAMRR